ncbi:MAG: XRE family transcriptional regulator [Solidesulfovibrio sp. DCME]|uniref:XRE family transcriptional regulator n=1 Tax=Solidesulfovibrio sp. DCME TaxID=3447380 RepID=UPI003D0D5053
MIRPSLAELPPDGPALRTEEDRCFWKALVELVGRGNPNQGDLAAFAGVSQGYVSKILAGKQSPKSAVRRRFAEFFDLSYEEMIALGHKQLESQDYVPEGPLSRRYHVRESRYGGESGRQAGLGGEATALQALLRDIRTREAQQLQYTEVPLREATGSMGGGSTETGDRTLTYLSFRTEWIRSKGNPEYMTVIRAFGDSMEPTIPDGSVVLVDEGRRQFVKNKIYYLRYNGQMYIKRLVDRDGHLCVASDNDPNLLLVADADDFEIIGRCIWTAKELD